MEPTEKEKALMECIAAIVISLKNLGYARPQFSGYRNPDNGALVILAGSQDEKTNFAIEVRTWERK
jgi:hypothetical protein